VATILLFGIHPYFILHGLILVHVRKLFLLLPDKTAKQPGQNITKKKFETVIETNKNEYKPKKSTHLRINFSPANLLFFAEPDWDKQKKEVCLHTSLNYIFSPTAYKPRMN
jgi:hypothetical protein